MQNCIGFIGTGMITEAIITGMMPTKATQVIVSPRGEETAARLVAKYPMIKIGADNQAVLDAADMVCLAIRPQIAEVVVSPLNFRSNQLVVSFVATVSINRLADWIGHRADIVRAIPLPFVARRSGVTAIYPPHPRVASFFSKLGTAVECETSDEFDALFAASGLMGTYFGILEHVTAWLVEKGVAEVNAREYAAPLFASLGEHASSTAGQSISGMRNEFSTRGGLNEQMYADFVQLGGIKAMTDAMNRVHQRIGGH